MTDLAFALSAGLLFLVPDLALVRSFGPRRLPRIPPPNARCPVMGEPARSDLFVDTKYGRIHVCCPVCRFEVLDDPFRAWRTVRGEVGGDGGGLPQLDDAR